MVTISDSTMSLVFLISSSAPLATISLRISMMLAGGAGESGEGGQAISQDPAAPWAFLPHQGSQFQNKGILNWVGAGSFLSTPYFKGGHDFIVSRAAVRQEGHSGTFYPQH